MALSVLAPGSAQLLRGSRRFGKIALSVWAGLIVTVLLVSWRTSMDDLAKLAVQPWILTTVRIVAFALAVSWVAVLVDAWRLGHPPDLSRPHRLVMVAATVALAVVVSTPFVVAARYAEAAHDLVVRMFPSGEVAAASDGRLNILLLGVDSGDGRQGTRPDSIHVVSVDVVTGEPALISLPRNLEKARFPAGSPAAAEFPDGFTGDGDRSDYLLNATWTYGEANPELFEGPSGPGPTAVKQAVEGTLGITMHYYVAVDLMGFRELVDALGGVTIDVQQELPIGDKDNTLEPGLQTLDGYHALWYARSRESTSDYDRMARQRCVLGAFFAKADPSAVLSNFLDLADASANTITTDIPRQDLENLVDLAFEAKDQKLMTLQFVPPLIVPADPDFGLIEEETSALLSGAGRDDATAAPGRDGDSAASSGSAGGDAEAESEANSAAEPTTGSADSGTAAADDAEEDDADEPTNVAAACSYG